MKLQYLDMEFDQPGRIKEAMNYHLGQRLNPAGKDENAYLGLHVVSGKEILKRVVEAACLCRLPTAQTLHILCLCIVWIDYLFQFP